MYQDSNTTHSNFSGSDNNEPDSVEVEKARILNLREDWVVIPYNALIVIDFIVSIIDFVYLQMNHF